MLMFQSIYTIVADFYNIEQDFALMLGQISLILLAFVLFPCAFLSDFVSVRKVVIASSVVVAIGSTLKTLASMPLEFSKNLFPLLLIGQIISQIPRAIALPYAGRLANLMLQSNQIARAVALGTSGFTLGMGLGYIIPAVIVTNQHIIPSPIIDNRLNASTVNASTSVEENSVQVRSEYPIDFYLMNKEMFWLNLSTLIFSLIILLGFLCLYKGDPLPFNYAERRRTEVLIELKTRTDQFKQFLKSYKKIFRNLNFIFLLTSFMLIHG